MTAGRLLESLFGARVPKVMGFSASPTPEGLVPDRADNRRQSPPDLDVHHTVPSVHPRRRRRLRE